MPYIYKKNNQFVVYAENAFDAFNSETFNLEDGVVETIANSEGLSKFIIDITTDSDGNIIQSEYEQVLKLDAERHQNNEGDDSSIIGNN